MKRFENGTMIESDEPPLEHGEWLEQQREAHAEEAKARAKSRRGGRAPAAGDDEPAGDDRTLHGHKLSVYRRKVGSAQGEERLTALKSFEGIGDAKAEEIAQALDQR